MRLTLDVVVNVNVKDVKMCLARKEITTYVINRLLGHHYNIREKKSAIGGLSNGCYISSPGYANCDMISSGTSNENFDDMVSSSDQQSAYSNYVESTNQFTPPDTTRHYPAFMSNLPPTTGWPDISRANENNLSPVISWPGSLVTPVSFWWAYYELQMHNPVNLSNR